MQCPLWRSPTPVEHNHAFLFKALTVAEGTERHSAALVGVHVHEASTGTRRMFGYVAAFTANADVSLCTSISCVNHSCPTPAAACADIQGVRAARARDVPIVVDLTPSCAPPVCSLPLRFSANHTHVVTKYELSRIVCSDMCAGVSAGVSMAPPWMQPMKGLVLLVA
jgi:hypothetical protein